MNLPVRERRIRQKTQICGSGRRIFCLWQKFLARKMKIYFLAPELQCPALRTVGGPEDLRNHPKASGIEMNRPRNFGHRKDQMIEARYPWFHLLALHACR